MSSTAKLMKYTKAELCKMVRHYEDGYDDVQKSIEELLKENENLRLESKRDSEVYYELLRYKNHIRDKYMRDLPEKNEKKNEILKEVEIEVISDLGGNVIKLN